MKTHQPEVIVVISPLSGADPMTFRVTMSKWQWNDIQQHESYAENVFNAFGAVVCENLELDIKKCTIDVQLEPDLRPGIDERAVSTGDVLSPSLFLH